jgi:hypothetical protein
VEISSFLGNLLSTFLSFLISFAAFYLALIFYFDGSESKELNSKLDRLVDGNEAILSMLIDNANRIEDLQNRIGKVEETE